jgi:hypothetical protein
MRRAVIIVLSMLIGTVTQASQMEPLCVINPDDMPHSWRPSGKVQQTLSTEPWSEKESSDAVYAIEAGLNQMMKHYEKRPWVVEELWDDAVESVIEVTYSGSNLPKLQTIGREAARNYLAQLVGPVLKRKVKTATCGDYENTLPLTIYTHTLFQKDDPRIAGMVAFTNAAYRKCGSLAVAMGSDYRTTLKKRNPATEDLFELVIWSTWIIEAERVPNLEMPKGAGDFPPALWHYLETFPLVEAEKYKGGPLNEAFIDMGYLATHIAFIPTGYHRHPIYVEDSPNLYRFIRRNFYSLMEMGEADLLAQFIDTLRQYGCDDGNDVQVRDGARYLLSLFHKYNDNWMMYPEPGMTAAEAGDYDLIHKAWSGIAGVRPRMWEPIDPGTYGALVRRWLPLPTQTTASMSDNQR